MSLLLNAAIKVSVILLAGFAAAALLRRHSAALRHWVLAAALICAAATPLLEVIVPAWHVPATSWSSSRRAIDPSEWITARDATTADASQAVTHGEPIARGRLLAAVPRALTALWLVGAAISAFILVIGLARLSWLASRAQPIRAGRWMDAATAVSRAYGLERPVSLLQSEHPTLLVTWGLVRPKVILPAPARDWPDARVRVVLCHELAHIRRRDWLVQLVAELLRSAYWFNPLLWMACRRVRQESEHACDDAVLRLGVEGPEYAAHLLDVARSFRAHRQLWSPALAIARPSSLERRVRAMLNAHLDRNPITRTTCILAVAALLAVTVPLAGWTAFADGASTTLSGMVVDQLGRGIPDVTLGLADAQTRARHEVHTDQTGHFEFIAVPSGVYAFDAKRPGFEALQASVTLAGSTMRSDLTLQIGTIHENITLTGNTAPGTHVKVSGPAGEGGGVGVGAGVGAGGGVGVGAGVGAGNGVGRPQRAEADPCLNSPAGGCILAPMKIRDVKPIYPEAELQTKVAGTVKLEGHITTDGSVANLQIVDASDPAFANAALDAVGQWQFTATHLDGTPVDTRMIVMVTFRPL
ncbi:MAG TPA: M56 family metallopeptidase [Vicinamibacterales bacterium]|nr:M56 family metallopeptidase [Vicinamibacterales bacterium]